MLARVLLHMIATALRIDIAVDDSTGLQRRGLCLEEMNHLAGLLILGDLTHAQARDSGPSGTSIQPVSKIWPPLAG